MSKIAITPFFDDATNTLTYVVSDKASGLTAVIDPVMDYDSASGTLSSQGIDKVIHFLDENELQLEWILETHAHADHVTAAHYLKQKRGGHIGIGEHIGRVQDTFKSLFNLESDFPCDGRQFDHLFVDNEIIKLGHVNIHVMHTPGHTPACVSYLIEDAVFVGDTLFMPDYGTARADFPLGSAKVLYHSITRLLSLPMTTRMFVGHDYKAPGREEFAWETTVIEQQRNNVHVNSGITCDAFVKMRNERDATLAVPKLLLPSIQMNIRAGQLPPKEDNGKAYLKIPLTQK